MEIKEFVQLSEDELEIAFNRLQKMIQPVFSGAVDTLINKIDPHKAVSDDFVIPPHHKKKVNYKKRSNLNDIEATLIEEHKHYSELLKHKRLVYGQWTVLSH